MAVVKIDEAKLVQHLQSKWTKPCPMCGVDDWAIDNKTFYLSEFHRHSVVIGGAQLVVTPITCANCGNTIFLNAVSTALIDDMDDRDGSEGS